MLCTLFSVYYVHKVLVYCTECSSCSKLLNSVYVLTWYSSLGYLSSEDMNTESQYLPIFTKFLVRMVAEGNRKRLEILKLMHILNQKNLLI